MALAITRTLVVQEADSLELKASVTVVVLLVVVLVVASLQETH